VAILQHQTLSVNLIMFDTAGNYSQLICAAMRFGFPVTTDIVIGRYRGNRCLSSDRHVSNIGGHISSNVREEYLSLVLTLLSNSKFKQSIFPSLPFQCCREKYILHCVETSAQKFVETC